MVIRFYADYFFFSTTIESIAVIISRYNEELNSLHLHDHMFYTSILMYVSTHENSHLDLVDYANIVSTHTLLDKKKDQPLFRDHVAKMWYSE